MATKVKDRGGAPMKKAKSKTGQSALVSRVGGGSVGRSLRGGGGNEAGNGRTKRGGGVDIGNGKRKPTKAGQNTGNGSRRKKARGGGGDTVGNG
jgi:hypothetical protein